MSLICNFSSAKICNIHVLFLNSEYEDLTFGQLTLQYLVERHGVPVFNDIETALLFTEKVF